MKKSVLCLLSGGIDSTVAVKHYLDRGWDAHGLFINYGQVVSSTELGSAMHISKELGFPIYYHIMGIKLFVADKFFYPMRNAFLLCFAINMAYGLKILDVALGASTGDYLDIRPEFIDRFNFMQEYCLKKPIWVLAPFAHWSKERVIKYGLKIEAPLHLTYSCMDYPPCGKCHDCKLREKYGIDRDNTMVEKE